MSTIRQLVRPFIPPIVVPQPAIYPTWAAAESASRSTYESALVNTFRIERAILRRAANVLVPTTSNLLYVTALLLRPQRLRITDFGGATGELGESLTAALPNVRYTVVENSALVEMAREKLGDKEIVFTTEIPEQCDIFFTSGTLQYTDDPDPIVETAFRTASKAVVLVRNSFSSRELFRVQRSRLFHNGSGPIPAGYADCEVAYPHRTIDEEVILSRARRYGFSCLVKTTETDGILPYKDLVYGRQLVFVRETIGASVG